MSPSRSRVIDAWSFLLQQGIRGRRLPRTASARG
jgi:hypothetical protein